MDKFNPFRWWLCSCSGSSLQPSLSFYPQLHFAVCVTVVTVLALFLQDEVWDLSPHLKVMKLSQIEVDLFRMPLESRERDQLTASHNLSPAVDSPLSPPAEPWRQAAVCGHRTRMEVDYCPEPVSRLVMWPSVFQRDELHNWVDVPGSDGQKSETEAFPG